MANDMRISLVCRNACQLICQFVSQLTLTCTFQLHVTEPLQANDRITMNCSFSIDAKLHLQRLDRQVICGLLAGSDRSPT